MMTSKMLFLTDRESVFDNPRVVACFSSVKTSLVKDK